MKLEHLYDDLPEMPTFRLYEYNYDDLGKLRILFDQLAGELIDSMALHEQGWILPIDDCSLTLYRRSWDQNLHQVGHRTYHWGLRPISWNRLSDKIESLQVDGYGFQWLDQVVLTPDGSW